VRGRCESASEPGPPPSMAAALDLPSPRSALSTLPAPCRPCEGVRWQGARLGVGAERVREASLPPVCRDGGPVCDFTAVVGGCACVEVCGLVRASVRGR